MSIYSMETESLQSFVNILSQCRPNVGRTVIVRSRNLGGRKKHDGKVGRVTWHGVDKYKKPFRYGDSATHLGTQAMGTHGYRVRVQPIDGSEAFFVDAESVIVCLE